MKLNCLSTGPLDNFHCKVRCCVCVCVFVHVCVCMCVCMHECVVHVCVNMWGST